MCISSPHPTDRTISVVRRPARRGETPVHQRIVWPHSSPARLVPPTSGICQTTPPQSTPPPTPPCQIAPHDCPHRAPTLFSITLISNNIACSPTPRTTTNVNSTPRTMSSASRVRFRTVKCRSLRSRNAPSFRCGVGAYWSAPPNDQGVRMNATCRVRHDLCLQRLTEL